MRKETITALAWAIATSLSVAAQLQVMSLNSADKHVTWTVTPQDEVSAKGQEVSQPGFVFTNGVVATVPGVVFVDYVNAGHEENPDLADNIYRVDETKYSKPFWYRTEFTPLAVQEDQHVWLCFDI